MKIDKKLKETLERFLYLWPNSEEFGGFLLASKRGHYRKVSFFLPVPNIAEEPQHRFRFPDRAKALAEKLANSKRMEVIAEWHSHPSPCIMSVADVSVASNENLFFVMISSKDGYGRNFVWYACKGIKPEEIEFV